MDLDELPKTFIKDGIVFIGRYGHWEGRGNGWTYGKKHKRTMEWMEP